MTTVAIMQPTYLPWLGYFSLMDQVDAFVFLDTVQFVGGSDSWLQRNRIKAPHGEMMLTIPVAKKGLRFQNIADAAIIHGREFPQKHIRAITINYGRAPFFDQYAYPFFAVLQDNYTKLADLNIAICDWLAKVLGLNSRRIRASSLDNEGKKADLLAHLCRQLNAHHYISPLRSRDYLKRSSAFPDSRIKISYHIYEHPVYVQLYPPFLPFMAVIDLLMNAGPESLNIIRSGQRGLRGENEV
jgi:hypothetical protein